MDEPEPFNCSAMVLANNTVCLEHPEEMLKPWKTHPMFFEIVVIHAIIFVFGVFGNVAVIAVMAGDRKSRSGTNFFLVSLAVGDLLMLCIYGPLETYTHFVIRWDETGAVCKAAKFAESVSATSSVLNLLAVTIERFIVIVFPMKSQSICTVGNIVKSVLTVWILSTVLAFPAILTTKTYKMTFTNTVTSLTLNYCTSSGESPDYVIYQFFIIFFVPSITMTVCYSFVIRELWVSTKKMNLLTNGVGSRRRISKSSNVFLKRKNFNGKPETVVYAMNEVELEFPERMENSRNFKRSAAIFGRNLKKSCLTCPVRSMGKIGSSRPKVIQANNRDEANHARKQVIKMLILVIVLFYLCWGPRVSMDMLQKFNFIPFNQSVYKMRIVFNVMTFFHGCINPFIYSFMSKNFRARLVRYLEKCGCKSGVKCPPRFGRTVSRFPKSRPISRSRRNDPEGKQTRAKVYGSFISCETKSTDLESPQNPSAQPGSGH